MIRLRSGEGPCPRHRESYIKWEIWGKTSTRLTPTDKAIKVTPLKPREGLGKIECNVMSEEGSCLIDWGSCPINAILQSLAKTKHFDY